MAHLVEDFARRHSPLTFVQIGANDGVTSDNIHSLILEHKWSGILVEPVLELFQILQVNYAGVPGLKFEQAAIAEHDGEATMYRVRDDVPGLPSYADRVHSLKREITLKEIGGRADALVAVTVPALTLPSLLMKHGFDRLDVLAIDTEGADFEIVRQIDFSRVKPSLIIYEHKHLSVSDRAACRKLLSQQNYAVRPFAQDTVAVLRSA